MMIGQDILEGQARQGGEGPKLTPTIILAAAANHSCRVAHPSRFGAWQGLHQGRGRPTCLVLPDPLLFLKRASP